jgi:hypothetical protein
MLDMIYKDHIKFTWIKEANKLFEKLKVIFTSVIILLLFDYKKETIIETNSSG